MSGTADVMADLFIERAKQRARWPAEHDDSHDDGALADAASHLALPDDDIDPDEADDEELGWAVRLKAKYSHDRRRQLVIAAALLIAEIERIDRAGGAR